MYNVGLVGVDTDIIPVEGACEHGNAQGEGVPAVE